MIKTLCLSGGGTKGICYIGAIKYLECNNYLKLKDIDTFVGTSAGSIMSFFFNIGYTIEELNNFILEFNFQNLEPNADSIFFLTKFGMDDGEKIMTIIKTFLFEKFKIYDLTFKELFDKTKKKLKIFSTNYTKAKSEMFSVDTTPDCSVIQAIRMSISVPFLFTPVEYNDCYYIDGGITNNFPIRYCDPSNSLGITIINREGNLLDRTLDSLPKYFMGICSLAIDSISLNQICNDDLICSKSKYNYFEINCKQKGTLNFSLSKKNIEILISEGKESAKIFASCQISKEVIDNIIEKIEK